MNFNEQITRISQIPFFSTLDYAELAYLSEKLQLCEFSVGELLLQEGEADDRFFILLDGEVEVVKALDTPDERLSAIRSQGALLGEMSLFSRQGHHTASVRAKSHLQALEMTRQEFDALLHRHPTLAYEMMRLVSRRLEESENATIIDLREKNSQLLMAYQELQAAQAQLVEKERLEKELTIAHEIQQSILPDRVPKLTGFDIAALTIPARAVGGDYYDFISLDEEHFGLVVGDACDKGIPAALFIALTNSLVRVEATRNPSPKAALRQVNRHLMGMTRSGMFVTLLYGILDVSGRFDYCRAGHPHPLIFDRNLKVFEPSRDAKTVTGMPLGLMEEIQLDARSAIIPEGGMALIYSDGLSEAIDGNGAEFGVVRLAEAIIPIANLSAAETCSQIWSVVQTFQAGQPQSDDFTLMVVKRTLP